MTPEQYRASLQPAVESGKITEQTADMLTEDYAEIESQWEIAKRFLNDHGFNI